MGKGLLNFLSQKENPSPLLAKKETFAKSVGF
jgi:hypothetical protein